MSIWHPFIAGPNYRSACPPLSCMPVCPEPAFSQAGCSKAEPLPTFLPDSHSKPVFPLPETILASSKRFALPCLDVPTETPTDALALAAPASNLVKLVALRGVASIPFSQDTYVTTSVNGIDLSVSSLSHAFIN